ncbi:MAG: bifunctional DNA primase/polymerase, partial [Xanthobacteraceae bacterium]
MLIGSNKTQLSSVKRTDCFRTTIRLGACGNLLNPRKRGRGSAGLSKQTPSMNSETALRQQLREAGYAPIPVNGKRPALEGWQTKANTKPQEINEWEEVFFYAKNTGLLTEHTPTLDIDILDQEAATAVEELVRERFEERGYILVRFGQSPKRAIPFRTDTPFSKITCNVEIPDREDRGEKLEFLANGQQ